MTSNEYRLAQANINHDANIYTLTKIRIRAYAYILTSIVVIFIFKMRIHTPYSCILLYILY